MTREVTDKEVYLISVITRHQDQMGTQPSFIRKNGISLEMMYVRQLRSSSEVEDYLGRSIKH